MKDVRLLYASRASAAFDPSDLDDILETARKRNADDGITGMLFFTATYFIQCLEGGRGPVNELYRDIVADPRHEHVVLMSYHEIDKRMFFNWRMAYIAPGEISEEMLVEHSVGSGFDPSTIDQETSDKLLVFLAKHLER